MSKKFNEKNSKGKGSKNSSDYKKNNYSKNKGKNSRDNEEYVDQRGHVLVKEVSGKENDPAWYRQIPQLVKDVTKIPFNSQIGRPVSDMNGTLTVPGICVLSTYTCPGIAKTSSDGINLAGQQLFTTIRQNLSTYASYAQADVTMYVLMVNEIYKQYVNMVRFFGVVNLYSPYNMNYNKQLLRAMGLSANGVSNFIKNINDYRSQLNNLVYKAQTIYLPDIFPIVRRHSWLFSNIFTDRKDPRAQIYLHVPGNFWTLDETGESGTRLIPMTPGNSEVFEWAKFQDLLDLFDRSIEVFRNSDSMLKIGADMRHAFDNKAAWQLSYIPEDFVIMPSFSEEVLSQIENTIITPGAPTTDLAITQDVLKNTTLYNPTWEDAKLKEKGIVSAGYVMYDNALINMHWIDPSDDDVAVATRDMVSFSSNNNTTNPGWILDSCGSDFVTSAKIWTLDSTTGNTRVTNLCYNMLLADPSDAFVGEDYALTLDGLMDYFAFDWAPRIHVGGRATVAGFDHPVPRWIPPHTLVEFDNYTSISRNLLERIHNNVIMSMWAIGDTGTFK
uniref:Capsid protein n=1 Tax=Dromedary picobirnavirus TaxID=1574421 RepID=A0A0A1ENX7_9VIRU|nr:capsid protein [Dromedary picobirnavirus]